MLPLHEQDTAGSTQDLGSLFAWLLVNHLGNQIDYLVHLVQSLELTEVLLRLVQELPH